MGKNEKQVSRDLVEACQRLADAAETFVNRAPRQKRLEGKRLALFDALAHAQLVLSVTRLPQRPEEALTRPRKWQRESKHLAENVNHLKAELAKSQQAREQLDWLLQPLATTLEEIKDKAEAALKTASPSPARVLPFKRMK